MKCEREPARAPAIIVAEGRCKGCALCVKFCPAGCFITGGKINSSAYHPVEVVNADKCTGCRACLLMCPDMAISIRNVGTHRPTRH